jgi:hypothetical protein
VIADVNNAGQLGKGTQDLYVNGSTNVANNFQMDGADINNFGTGRADNWLGYAGIGVPNPDAIQEFKVQTTLYDAGYGRNTGANVNVVTKSGTNDIHGSAFEFFRNDALNANDFFLNSQHQPRPVLKQNQFGGTFGGPIKKDKLFYFGSYQGTRQANGIGLNSLSTTLLPPLTNDRSAATLGKEFCEQTGEFGGVAIACDGSNINPTALKLLNVKLSDGSYFIPTPQSILSNGSGFSAFSIPSHFTEDQVLANVDYMISSKHSLSERFFYARDPQTVAFTVAGQVPGAGAIYDYENRNVILKLTSVMTSHMVNQAKLSYTRNAGTDNSLTPVKDSDIGLTPVGSCLPIDADHYRQRRVCHGRQRQRKLHYSDQPVPVWR